VDCQSSTRGLLPNLALHIIEESRIFQKTPLYFGDLLEAMGLILAIFAHLSRFTSDSVSLTGEFSTKFRPENYDFDLYEGFFMGEKTRKSPDFEEDKNQNRQIFFNDKF
jgi:hypothetical protein